MPTIHTAAGVQEIISRIDQLTPQSPPLWGKMNVSQMLCHLQGPLEVPLGRHHLPKSFLMKLLGPMIRKQLLADKPLAKNSPTANSFRVLTEKDFDKEKQALITTLKDYSNAAQAGRLPSAHPYWGKLSIADWDKMQWKHLDHHLTQFGV
jgi:hypothetical protein